MTFKNGLCQMAGSLKEDMAENKKETWAKAEQMIREAASNGAQIIALPEMWNCPYSNDFFRAYSESADGETVGRMSELAKTLGIYLIGGSIPELDDDRVYNTCFAFDREGQVIGKHRKAHLFDIDVKGGIRFMESDTLTAGDAATVIDTEYGKIGIAICYDVRFPELFRKMTLDGARMVFLPAAFNLTTGPAHWDLTMRARALDNQIYFAAISPARCMEGVYQAYGYSCVTTPWAEFAARAETEETIIYADIDFEYEDSIRDQLPLLKHRRPELY